MEELIKQLVSKLKKDSELNAVYYKDETLVLGVNPSSFPLIEANENEVAEYLNNKVSSVGYKIATRHKMKFYNRLVFNAEFMFSFEAKFIGSGPLMKIADRIWNIDNPSVVS